MHTGLAASGKAHESVAHIADGGIGEQAFDVFLADGGKRAQRHGEDAQNFDEQLPLRDEMAEGAEHDGHKQRHGGNLGRGAEEGGDRGWGA